VLGFRYTMAKSLDVLQHHNHRGPPVSRVNQRRRDQLMACVTCFATYLCSKHVHIPLRLTYAPGVHIHDGVSS
jgi:hypothetical protein